MLEGEGRHYIKAFENIGNFLNEERRATIQSISIKFGVGVAAGLSIIHEDLYMHRICDILFPGCSELK